MPRPITPVGRVRNRDKRASDGILLWSEKTPDGDHDFGTVTLNPGTFRGARLVVEDFGLGSPHAFRRRF